jgi:hypothetical protein
MRRYGYRSNNDGTYMYTEETTNNSAAIGFNATHDALNIAVSDSPGCIPTTPLYVSMNPTLGTYTFNSSSGTTFAIGGAGNISAPLHPSFMATITSLDSNVTGAGAVYQLGTNVAFTEIFDQGADFNTNGVFTAPVSGNYFFTAFVLCGGLTMLSTSLTLAVVTTAREYVEIINPSALFIDLSVATVKLSTFAPMIAGDTAHVTLTISGLAGNVADVVGSASRATVLFGGYLLL